MSFCSDTSCQDDLNYLCQQSLDQVAFPSSLRNVHGLYVLPPPTLNGAAGRFCGFSPSTDNLCRRACEDNAPINGFHPAGSIAFLRLFHHWCCCSEFLVAFLLFFLVFLCSLCFSFLASSLNCHLFCFLTEFFFYLPNIDGWFWFLLPTTDGCDDHPEGFCSIYGMLPFITASFGRLSSLDGPGLQLTHSRLFLFLRKLCHFRFSCFL